MPKCIEMFAGCGGMTQGFVDAGWDVSCVEMNKDACDAHERNIPSVSIYQHESTEEQPLPTELEEGNVDAIIGGPPCQSFSHAGAQRGAADPRNGIPAFLSAIKKLEPRCVVMENVAALCGGKHVHVLTALVHELQALDYKVNYRVLVASDYGVAQKRRRVILLASKLFLPSFPPATTVTPRTVQDALGAAAFTTHDESLMLTAKQDAYVARYETVSKCKNPRDLLPSRPARTLTCTNLACATGDMIRLKLVDGARRQLSIEEAALLQGFDTRHSFPYSRRTAMRLIGNAFPPPVACALAKHLRSQLETVHRAEGII
jgi:DNA (cytosine-5)-methyltransferase 1